MTIASTALSQYKTFELFSTEYINYADISLLEMGGVQIKNCTAVPLKIQLCQVGVLYHGLVKPGECFVRNTGAVHFTIVAALSDKDDTGFTDTVLPIVSVVGATLGAMATAGASLGLFAGVGAAASAIGLGSLVPEAIVTGSAAVMTLAGGIHILVAGGKKLTKELAAKLFKQAKKEHYYIRSLGWYFRGENHLEIHGGPKILATSEGFEYDGTPLRIVDKTNPSRHS